MHFIRLFLITITLIFISHKKGPLLKCDKIFDLNKNKLELNDQ